MSDLALISGDIISSNFGDIAVVDDDNDIIQMAINNISTAYGSNEFHPYIGNMVYNGRYKMSQSGLEEVASLCKNAIMQDYRVQNVIEIIAKDASTIENYGACEISFILVTTDGRQLNSKVTIIL